MGNLFFVGDPDGPIPQEKEKPVKKSQNRAVALVTELFGIDHYGGLRVVQACKVIVATFALYFVIKFSGNPEGALWFLGTGFVLGASMFFHGICQIDRAGRD